MFSQIGFVRFLYANISYEVKVWIAKSYWKTVLTS